MKLRAYDPISKTMFYQCDQIWSLGVNGINGKMSVSFPYGGGELTTSYVMMSTGLKDTKSIDIYEDDIVSFSMGHITGEFVVKWGYGGFVLSPIEVHGSSKVVFGIGDFESAEYLVMGNIHEGKFFW